VKEVHDTRNRQTVISTSAEIFLPFSPIFTFLLFCKSSVLLYLSLLLAISSALLLETMDTLSPLDPLAIHFENKFVTPPMLSKRPNGTAERNSHLAQHHPSRIRLAASVVVEGGASVLPIARLQAAHSLRIKDLRPPASFYYSLAGFPQKTGKDPSIHPFFPSPSCIDVLFSSLIPTLQKDSPEEHGQCIVFSVYCGYSCNCSGEPW
jgi:hypothetical protein